MLLQNEGMHEGVALVRSDTQLGHVWGFGLATEWRYYGQQHPDTVRRRRDQPLMSLLHLSAE